MKRLFAILIAAVFCLSLVGLTAFAATEYFVAGTEGLCGTAWAADDQFNKMTENEDGTYSITYPNVAVGTYEFKVTAGNWENCWGKDGQNYPIEVTTAGDVTITFNPNDQKITVTGASQVTGLVVNSVTVAGNGSAAWLNNANWDTGAEANKMTANGKIYTITYQNVPAGDDYQLKFAANGAWSDNWGLPEGTALELGTAMDAVYNAQNIFLKLDQASDVTVTLDLTNFDYESKNGAKFTITTKAVSSAQPEATQPSTEDTQATEPDTGATEGNTDGNIKVYAYVPESWANPGVWAWDDSQKNAFDAWPGLAMTKGEDGWWSAEVPAWVQNVIINANSGSAQTADLDMEKSADMWIVVTIENGTVNGVIHYEKPEVTPESQPSTEATQPSTEATKPATQPTTPSEPADGDEPQTEDNGVKLWVIIVVLVVSAGVGVGGVLLYHKLRDKKN